jgi:hypothetical protein
VKVCVTICYGDAILSYLFHLLVYEHCFVVKFEKFFAKKILLLSFFSRKLGVFSIEVGVPHCNYNCQYFRAVAC